MGVTLPAVEDHRQVVDYPCPEVGRHVEVAVALRVAHLRLRYLLEARVRIIAQYLAVERAEVGHPHVELLDQPGDADRYRLCVPGQRSPLYQHVLYRVHVSPEIRELGHRA